MKQLFEYILQRLNINSVSLFLAFIMIFAGAIMCFKEIQHTGLIDIKSAILSGKVQSGSLGLIVIFLGTVIIVAVVSANKGEIIEIKQGRSTLVFKNVSFRKVQEALNTVTKNTADKPE